MLECAIIDLSRGEDYGVFGGDRITGMMRLFRANSAIRTPAIVVGSMVVILGLLFLSSALRAPSTSKKDRTQAPPANGKNAGRTGGQSGSDSIAEVAVVSPSSGRSVGGDVNIVIRIVTRDADLSGLSVRIGQDSPKWPSNWTQLSKGAPPQPDSTRTDGDSGTTTAVYSWEWNTRSVPNGQYVLRVDADAGNANAFAEQIFTILDLEVSSCDPESFVLWQGEEGRTRPITIHLKDDDLHGDPVRLTLKLYPTEVAASYERPLRTFTANIAGHDPQARSLTWTFKWDGKDSRNSYVRPGVYTYEVEVTQESDGDSASYRSGDFANGRSRPHLTAGRARMDDGRLTDEAEFVGERDNGTLGKPDDDFFEYYVSYRLRDNEDADAIGGQLRLLDPRLKLLFRWNIADLVCREHNGRHDGLDASARGAQHSLLVRVPRKLMPPDGTYRFVLDFLDDYAFRYRNQTSRWALPITVLAPRYRIEGFRTGQFYVAWCRAEAIDDIAKRVIDVGWAERASPGGQLIGKANSGMGGAAISWVRDEPREVLLVKRGTTQVGPEMFGTGKGEIRAAVNGGLIGLPVIQPVGDMASDAGWYYHLPSFRPGLWAFSMERSGGGFTSAEVEKSLVFSDWEKRKLTDAYHAPRSIRVAYPYGRGAVGLLVKDGGSQDPPPWWPPILPGSSLSVDLPLQRTAIAFSDDVGGGRRHFFLVSASSCTWSRMADFLASDGGLQDAMRGMLGRFNDYPRRLKISRAFMLDGGTSSQFAYRATDSAGRIVGRSDGSQAKDLMLTRHDRPLTDIIAVRAACADLGNR